LTQLKPNQKVEKGIVYVPQLGNTFPLMTIRENLEMGGFSKDSEALKQGIEAA
jgi:ABC-type branched-subunit amino acid transport system ATPase component